MEWNGMDLSRNSENVTQSAAEILLSIDGAATSASCRLIYCSYVRLASVWGRPNTGCSDL
eukprot:1613006-Pyramimonas_sp.AAC.1